MSPALAGSNILLSKRVQSVIMLTYVVDIIFLISFYLNSPQPSLDFHGWHFWRFQSFHLDVWRFLMIKFKSCILFLRNITEVLLCSLHAILLGGTQSFSLLVMLTLIIWLWPAGFTTINLFSFITNWYFMVGTFESKYPFLIKFHSLGLACFDVSLLNA